MKVKEKVELHKCFSIEFIIKAMSTSDITLRQEAEQEFHHHVTASLTLGSFAPGQPPRLPSSKAAFPSLSLILWIVRCKERNLQETLGLIRKLQRWRH